MALRTISSRLTKHVWQLFRSLTKRQNFNILDVPKEAVVLARQAVQQGGVKTAGSTWGHHARNALIGNFYPKNTADLRKRVINRLFYGDSSKPLFALIGLSISGGLLTDDDNDDKYCAVIRDTVANLFWKSHLNKSDLNISYDSLTLEDLEIGNIFNKGCSGVVANAKIKETSEFAASTVVTENTSVETNPLALKIMYNYDIESSSPAILKAMYRETIPAQVCHISEQIPHWNYLFPTVMPSLPSHPNIVEIYHAFVDYMPILSRSMDIYPDALPRRHNPHGLGRNMTLFLLMKKYQYSLKDYLEERQLTHRNSVLLFTQLLEGVVHMNRHGIAHRDLKSDNLLIDEVYVDDEYLAPLLVITDFGCCLADIERTLRMRYETDDFDKGGNINLMAPEIISQRPGYNAVLDYNKSDLWAVGAIAYEIFGLENPFSPSNHSSQDKVLYSVNYADCEIPPMEGQVHKIIQHLIKNLLSRDPKKRLYPEIAANVCQLYLWAPTSWLIRSDKMPDPKEINGWLLQLTTKVLYERHLFKAESGINPEYALITSFLSRVDLHCVEAALIWIRSQSGRSFV